MHDVTQYVYSLSGAYLIIWIRPGVPRALARAPVPREGAGRRQPAQSSASSQRFQTAQKSDANSHLSRNRRISLGNLNFPTSTAKCSLHIGMACGGMISKKRKHGNGKERKRKLKSLTVHATILSCFLAPFLSSNSSNTRQYEGLSLERGGQTENTLSSNFITLSKYRPWWRSGEVTEGSSSLVSRFYRNV